MTDDQLNEWATSYLQNSGDKSLKQMLKDAFREGLEVNKPTVPPPIDTNENEFFDMWLESIGYPNKKVPSVDDLPKIKRELQKRVSIAWEALHRVVNLFGHDDRIFFVYPVKSPMLEVYDSISDICGWLEAQEAKNASCRNGSRPTPKQIGCNL